MSLAYKLWKIGSVLTKDDIKKSLQDIPEDNGKNYINISFNFNKDELNSISLSKNAPSINQLFFTKCIGGRGQGFYYLFPNIRIKGKPIDLLLKEPKAQPKNKINLLVNTINKSICIFSDKEFLSITKTISEVCTNIKDYLEEIKKAKLKAIKFEEIDVKSIWNKDLFKIIFDLSDIEEDDYWIWFSINGKTFYELMPEIFDNWYKIPVEADKVKTGFDIFTNKEIEVGYKPEVLVFSYDQYHDSLNYRIIENLPLSIESAKNIKFAWLYILDNLVFYYKGLEYIIIPNLLLNNDETYKQIIEKFSKANEKLKKDGKLLNDLYKEETLLIKKLKEKDETNQGLENKIEEIQKQKARLEVEKEIGIIEEFYKYNLSMDSYINSITLDYIFTSIDKKNLSFEIKGSIEDIIPSKISKLVTEMKNFNIVEFINTHQKDFSKTFLQDYFNREELYFKKKDMLYKKEKKSEIKNKILEERLFLIKLLLTDTKIKFDDLLERIEFNRFYNYEKKKRVDEKDKIQEWIKYTSSFTEKEENLINFLRKLDKIKE